MKKSVRRAVPVGLVGLAGIALVILGMSLGPNGVWLLVLSGSFLGYTARAFEEMRHA